MFNKTKVSIHVGLKVVVGFVADGRVVNVQVVELLGNVVESSVDAVDLNQKNILVCYSANRQSSPILERGNLQKLFGIDLTQ